MSDAKLIAEMYAFVGDSTAGRIILVPSVVEGVAGFGIILTLLSVFFFCIVWGGAPLIEWVIEGMLKGVDWLKEKSK